MRRVEKKERLNLFSSSLVATAIATSVDAACFNPAAFNLGDNGPLDTELTVVALDVLDLALKEN